MRVFFLSMILTLGVSAHTDLSKTIEALSKKIAAKPTAELYFQRALEYRALREKRHTIEDLRKAVELQEDFPAAKFALAEELGKSDEALGLALELSMPGEVTNLPLQSNLLLARVYRKRKELEQALAVCEKLSPVAAKTPRDDTEVSLLHADLLLDLNRPGEAAEVLKTSWKRTNSIVARNNWIDTALTAGQTKELLPFIENELQTSRLRSSWLIRRARAFLILDKRDAARTDLVSALLEINSRINPAQPDLTLIADRGLVHALMGNPALARRDLATLQKTTLPSSAYQLLSDALGATDGETE